ncbi:uncharacterized protein LOC128750223 isoform X2 [Synchiropus splendidus]|uniref:uncharacterized protein LOC128750223 isoform X2 n=1 Tax=Synchiropus splendidus TaxID=270530 RepID=UPI00237D4FF2|nr:uncharacterized protein LOC128750223 isoform X2 [Synchiropus splendidus]
MSHTSSKASGSFACHCQGPKPCVTHDKMDETSPLLGYRADVGPAIPSPNLRPRHQELIPTPCGPIKSWSELSGRLQFYFCFTIASLLVLLGLTIASINKQLDTGISEEDNLAVSLIQLVGILFCIYYIVRGILQDNRQELLKFLLSVLVLMVRSVVNYCELKPQGKTDLLARFVSIMIFGVIHLVCSTLLIRTPGMMAFRVSGALKILQDQYFLLNRCFSLVTFDLQAQRQDQEPHHPGSGSVLGLSDRWGGSCRSSERVKAAGCGLHGPEPSSGGLLCLRHVRDCG